MKNSFPHHIFREYDIRGIAGSEIDTSFAYTLGVAFAGMLGENRECPVIVGRDVRLSGMALQSELMRGLNDAGYDVLDIGIVPTPLVYFATHQMDAAGSIQVTASHNPAEYNGFKMMMGKLSLQGEDIQQLKKRMLQTPATTEEKGTNQNLSITESYINFVAKDCQLKRPLKVVIDAGNGPSGVIAAPLYRQLGCEVIELYCEPDGNFPNHHPDPTIEKNLRDLARTVRHEGADLGIAFDGDGDRIGIVDAHGDIIWPDMLLLLLSRQLLQSHPGAVIISEVKSSQHMYDGIVKAGGKPIMWRTGHSPIKAKIKETGALLAGEMSGHIFFADRFFGFDDAAYAGARVMQMLADSRAGFAELLTGIPESVSTPEIRIPCSDTTKFIVVESAIAHFSSRGYDIVDIDGMRIQFDDGWGLLRASNTQPALVMRFEAPTEVRLQEMRDLIEGWLKNSANDTTTQ